MRWQSLYEWMLYRPRGESSSFVLKENTAREVAESVRRAEEARESARRDDLAAGAREAVRLAREVASAESEEARRVCRAELTDFARREEELAPVRLAYRHGFVEAEDMTVSCSIEENANTLRRLYHADRTDDLKLRFFTMKGTMRKSLLLAYIDGMVDAKLVTQAVLMPLMLLAEEAEVLTAEQLSERIEHRFLPMMQAVDGTDFGAVVKAMNKGGGALFAEGRGAAFLLEMAGYPSRSVGKAEIEGTVRGSQSSFTESMRGNISQVRAMLRSEDLVAEVVTVGRIGRKECAILSVDGIADPALVHEIRRRIEGVAVDYVFDCGALMQYLTADKAQFPSALTTERPDRTADALMEGRAAILLEGDPFAAILPVSLWDFFHSTEDHEMRAPSAVFMRVLRYLGALVTMLLPALYIAMTYFHQEAIPSQLLVVIAGYRQMVPFPSLIEMLLLIVSFEFIREATLRVPSRLGGSISIVGAIILGQAAVTAKLVSPVLVVVVALTGLASYILPEYRFAFSLRVCQYVFLLAGALTGLVGISLVSVLLLVELAGMESMGMPFLAPLMPRLSLSERIGEVLGGQNAMRPDGLNPSRIVKQEKDGRLWEDE